MNLIINNGTLTIVNTNTKIQNNEEKNVDNTKVLLRNFNLSVSDGETIGIFAPNGSGKTTLINALFKKPNCHLEADSIIMNYCDTSIISTSDMFSLGVGLIQQSHLQINNITYYDLLSVMLNSNSSLAIYDLFHNDTINLNQLTKYANNFGIEKNLLFKFLGLCSAGERKILDLFLLSLFNLNLIFIDEFDANLDLENKNKFMAFLDAKRKANSNISFVIISHDQEFLNECNCKKIYTIKNFSLVELRTHKLVK